MTRTVRKVVIVNTADQGGGAERFASMLLDGLLRRHIDAWMVVGNKLSDDPRVIPIHSSPFIDYRPYDNVWHRHIVPTLRTLEGAIGLESHRYPFSHRLYDITGSAPDVVLACNLHGGFFDIRALLALDRRIPVVVRPGDAWLMTGHCAVPATCERWRTGCGRCPDLARPPSVQRDLTSLNRRRKERIYRSARWSIVAPSDWQMIRINQSILQYATGSRYVIRNGVDQTKFRPGPQRPAREVLQLDPTRIIGLVVANLGRASPSKDFHTLRAALARLSKRSPAPNFDIVVVGREGPCERFGAITVHHRAHCASPDHLALYYQAGNFLVNSTHEETFSNVLAEAMCCALPVLATQVAAVGEIVSGDQTGILVPASDVEALVLALDRLSRDDGLRRTLAGNAAARARELFSIDRMIENYIAVFEELAAQQVTRRH